MNHGAREEIEAKLIASYEAYSALKRAYRSGEKTKEVFEALLREVQLQRYLHGLLGEKGEPTGLLY